MQVDFVEQEAQHIAFKADAGETAGGNFPEAGIQRMHFFRLLLPRLQLGEPFRLAALQLQSVLNSGHVDAQFLFPLRRRRISSLAAIDIRLFVNPAGGEFGPPQSLGGRRQAVIEIPDGLIPHTAGGRRPHSRLIIFFAVKAQRMQSQLFCRNCLSPVFPGPRQRQPSLFLLRVRFRQHLRRLCRLPLRIFKQTAQSQDPRLNCLHSLCQHGGIPIFGRNRRLTFPCHRRRGLGLGFRSRPVLFLQIPCRLQLLQLLPALLPLFFQPCRRGLGLNGDFPRLPGICQRLPATGRRPLPILAQFRRQQLPALRQRVPGRLGHVLALPGLFSLLRQFFDSRFSSAQFRRVRQRATRAGRGRMVRRTANRTRLPGSEAGRQQRRLSLFPLALQDFQIIFGFFPRCPCNRRGG